MAIFNSIFESYTTDVLDEELEKVDELGDDVAAEPEGGDDIVKEFCRDFYMLEATMYVMDIQLETAVFEGASIESVMENVLTDLIKKAKDSILKLWNKLKNWIRDRIRQLKTAVAASTNFVKKHKSDILKKYNKNKKGFKPTGYLYENDKSFEAAKASITEVRNQARNATGSPEDIDAAMANVGAKFKGFEGVSLKDVDNIETGSLAALGAVMTSACRGTELEGESVVKESDVQRWIDTCLGAQKTITALSKDEDDAKKEISKIIDELKKAEAKAKALKTDAGDTDAANIRNTITFNNRIAALVSKVTTVVVNIRCEQFKTYSRYLRQINGLKGEDANEEDDKTEDVKRIGTAQPKALTVNKEALSTFGMF